MKPVKSQVSEIVGDLIDDRRLIELEEEEENRLKRASKIAGYLCLFLCIAMLVVWPMPMYGSKYVFSKKFFTGWVVVGFIWIFFTAFMVIIFPLYEGREGIYTSLRGIYWDLTGQSHKLIEWQNDHPEQLHAVQSQMSAEIRRRRRIGNIDDNLD